MNYDVFMKEKYRLYICETKMELTFNSNDISIRDHINAILKALNTDGKAVSAVCLSEKSETPLAMIHKMAGGEIMYYLPE